MYIILGVIAFFVIVGVLFSVNDKTKPVSNALDENSIKSFAKKRRQDIEQIANGAVLTCVHRGGDWFPMDFGSAYYLSIFDNNLVISHAISEKELSIRFEDITDITISGPGATVTNGGFVGGGFGIEGALEGMAIATLANVATTRTTYDTIFRVTSIHGVTIFQFNDIGPNELASKFPSLSAALLAKKIPKFTENESPQTNDSDLSPLLIIKTMEFVSTTALVLFETIYEEPNEVYGLDIENSGPQDCIVNGLKLYALRILSQDGVVDKLKIKAYSSVISALLSYDEKESERIAREELNNYSKLNKDGSSDRWIPVFYISQKLYDDGHATLHSKASTDFLLWFAKNLIDASQINEEKSLIIQQAIKNDFKMELEYLLKKYQS